MSGHSKWHNIKRKKGLEDQKRSKWFSKVSRLIIVAAKHGGGDPDANPSLRLAILKAKEARMPKENIDRAIKKGTGELGGESFQETVYEGFGPFGGAFLVSCLTDNINRTVSDVRSIFSRFGGSMGDKGSTSYIFNTADKAPLYTVDVNSEDQATKVDDMMDELEDLEDVQEVSHNYIFS